jgi:phage terminase small subunit
MRALAQASNEKPWVFVLELLADPNLSGTQAAKNAGYAVSSATSQSTRLLKRDDVRGALAEGRAALAQRFRVTADRITQELAAAAFTTADEVWEMDQAGQPLRLKSPHLISRTARKAIKTVKVKTSWRIQAPQGTAGVQLEQQGHGGALKRSRFKRPGDIVSYFDQPAEDREDDAIEVIEVEQTVEVELYDKVNAAVKLREHLGLGSSGGDEGLGPKIGGIIVNVFSGAVPHVGADGEVRVPATISEAVEAQEARTQVGGVGVAVRVIGPTD